MNLKQLLKQTQDPNNVIAVFDIDSTLFDVSPRTQKILDWFSEHPEMVEEFKEECEHMKNVKMDYFDWGFEDAFERHYHTFSKPFFTALEKFWREHFFHGKNFVHDLPYKGAIEFVQSLDKKEVSIYYLTARKEDSHQYTEDILQSWNFPYQKGRLYSKKINHKVSDAVYKSEVIKALKTSGKEVWLFENDPKNLLQVEKDSPEVKLIFIDTTHSRTHTPRKEWFRVTPPHFFEELLVLDEW